MFAARLWAAQGRKKNAVTTTTCTITDGNKDALAIDAPQRASSSSTASSAAACEDGGGRKPPSRRRGIEWWWLERRGGGGQAGQRRELSLLFLGGHGCQWPWTICVSARSPVWFHQSSPCSLRNKEHESWCLASPDTEADALIKLASPSGNCREQVAKPAADSGSRRHNPVVFS